MNSADHPGDMKGMRIMPNLGKLRATYRADLGKAEGDKWADELVNMTLNDGWRVVDDMRFHADPRDVVAKASIDDSFDVTFRQIRRDLY